MADYQFVKNETIQKKMVGVYNATSHKVCLENGDVDILDELKDFDGEVVNITIATKSQTDLTDDVSALSAKLE